jgi:hypothetical protein
LSAASLRQQFSIPENIRMSLFGLEFLRGAKERFGADTDLAWHEGGYLILASETGRPILEANHRVQQAEGADIALMDPATLKATFPWLNVEDIAAGAYGVSGEGWFDAHALLACLRTAAKAQGAHFITAEVAAIARAGDRIAGVTLTDGRRLRRAGQRRRAVGRARGGDGEHRTAGNRQEALRLRRALPDRAAEAAAAGRSVRLLYPPGRHLPDLRRPAGGGSRRRR